MKRDRFIALLVVAGILSVLVLQAPPVAAASFPVVELANGAALPGGGTFVLPLPTGSGGIRAGDLLIAVWARNGGSWGQSCDSQFPTWTFIANFGDPIEICAKIADGSEVSLSRSNPSDLVIGQSFRVIGWFDSGPLGSDSIAGVANRVVGGNPDPPALNPGGWDVEQTLWLAGGAMSNNGGGRDISGCPSGYTLIRYDDGSASSMMSCERKESVASVDPGTFSTTMVPDQWQSFTIAIRPSVAVPLVTLPAAPADTFATLWGRLDILHGSSVELKFEYGLTPALGSSTDTIVKSEAGLFNILVSGLALQTTYHFRAVSLEIPSGYNATGEILTFTTEATNVLFHIPELMGLIAFILIMVGGPLVLTLWAINRGRRGGRGGVG